MISMDTSRQTKAGQVYNEYVIRLLSKQPLLRPRAATSVASSGAPKQRRREGGFVWIREMRARVEHTYSLHHVVVGNTACSPASQNTCHWILFDTLFKEREMGTKREISGAEQEDSVAFHRRCNL